MPLAGGIIAGAGVLANGVESIFQNKAANDIKPKQDPVYNIPQEFYQNREIARQMAQIGMPQQQYNNSVNNINGTQAAALATAQNSSNPAAAITGIVSGTNRAKGNLDAEDSQARENNQRYFINENSQVADQELKKQQSDVFDKFTRDFNQYQALKGASMQSLNNAISGAQQIGGAIAGNATGGGNSTARYDAIDPGVSPGSSFTPSGGITSTQVPTPWSDNPINPLSRQRLYQNQQNINLDWPVPYGGN